MYYVAVVYKPTIHHGRFHSARSNMIPTMAYLFPQSVQNPGLNQIKNIKSLESHLMAKEKQVSPNDSAHKTKRDKGERGPL